MEEEVNAMINTVLFDMGGTIEDLYSDQKTMRRTAEGIIDILRRHDLMPDMGIDQLWESVSAGMARYKAYSEATCTELKPEQIWPDYALNGLSINKEKIIPISEELAHMWEITYFDRKMRSRVPEMLEGLRSLGLRMGVISNTASLFQVFDTLEEYNIRSYFEDVTLSSIVGYRKPHPNIFRISLRQMNVEPQTCVYVGDTLSRDIIGPQNVGFGMTMMIQSFLTASRDVKHVGLVEPDYRLSDIYDVYTILKEQVQELHHAG